MSKIFIRSGFPIDSDDVATYLLREENLSAQEIKALFRCIPKKERKLLFRKLNMINILYGEFSLKYTLNEKEWRGLRLRGEFSAKRTLKEEDFRELRQYVSGFPDGEAIISELMSYELSPSAQVMPLDAAEQIQAVLDFLLPSSRSYLSLQNIIEGSKKLLPLSREQQPVDSAKDMILPAGRTFIEEFRAVCADDAKLIGFMEQILDETVEIPSVEEVREMIPILQDLVDNHQSSRIRGLVLDLAMEIADVLERMEAMEAKSARHNAFMGELAKFSRGYVENGAFINDISLETQKKIIEALESAGIKEIKVKISSPMNMVEIEESVRLLLDFLLGLDDNQRKTILRENANILKFSIENYNGKRLSCVAIYNNEGLAHEDKNDTGSWSAIERIYYGGKVFSNWLEFMRYKFGRK
ncbi:hypothetical protein HZC34_02795 [Candidatus Saganbacteria bacterium]|nr:hypothetical protein [Candidatus Saganbacteria bacterium]